MIELRCLGSIDLGSPGVDSATRVLAQPKRFALLAYLAVAKPRGFHRRDTLIALFWPESDEEHARSGLRIALHFLRRELGEDVIVTRGDDVAVNEEAVLCDATVFESELDAGALEPALALYRGDLAPGLHISNSPEFERWLDAERERLRRRAHNAALQLSAAQDEAGNTDAAAKWMRLASALAPDDEADVQRMIRLLDRAGDRAGALRTYELFAQRMATEFESEPSPETRALVDDIRARSSVSSGYIAPAVHRRVAAGQGSETLDQTPAKVHRRAFVISGFIAAMALVFAATVLWNLNERRAIARTRIAVVPLQNQTGRPNLDYVGSLAADQIARSVGDRNLGDVVASPAVGEETPEGAAAGDAIRQVARDTRAGLVVSGAYSLEADTLRLRAKITDATDQRLLAVLGPVPTPGERPSDGIAMLSAQVTSSLVRLFDARVSAIIRQRGWAKPRALPALQAFSDGLELFLGGKSREDYENAIEHFSHSYALDTTATTSLFEIVLVEQSLEEYARADSLLTGIDSLRGRLEAGDGLFLDFLAARNKGNHKEAFNLARRKAEGAPSVVWEYLTGYHALSAGRPRDAVRVMAALNPDKGFLKGVWGYRGIMAEANHLMGDHRNELELAKMEREKYPQLLSTALYEARALAALGRLEELRLLLNGTPSLPPQSGLIPALPPLSGLTPGSIMTEAGLELRAHDQAREARQAINQAITWYESRPGTDQRSELAQKGLAEALYAANRMAEARALFERLAQQYPNRVDYQGYLGAIAARQGRNTDAVAASATLAKWAEPFSFGGHTFWRARIASQLGDRQAAVLLLRRALAEGHPFGIEIHRDIDFEPLHSFRPFEDLLQPQK